MEKGSPFHGFSVLDHITGSLEANGGSFGNELGGLVTENDD